MLNLKKWYTTVFLCHNWHVTTIISYYYRDQLPRSTGAPKEEKSKPLSCQAWEITVLHYHNCGHTVKIMQTTNKHFDYSLCCAVEIRSSILWCIMNADLEEHFHKKLCKISETFRVMCGFLKMATQCSRSHLLTTHSLTLFDPWDDAIVLDLKKTLVAENDWLLSIHYHHLLTC